MEPDFWVPPLIGPMLMRREVADQMAGVLAEIAAACIAHAVSAA